MRKLLVSFITIALVLGIVLPGLAVGPVAPIISSGGTSAKGAKAPSILPAGQVAPNGLKAPVVAPPPIVGGVKQTTPVFVEGLGGVSISESALFINMGPSGPDRDTIRLKINGKNVTLQRMTSENGNKIYKVALSEIPNNIESVKSVKVSNPRKKSWGVFGFLGGIVDAVLGTPQTTETTYGPQGNPLRFKIEPATLSDAAGGALGHAFDAANSIGFKPVSFGAGELPLLTDSRKVDAPYSFIKDGRPYTPGVNQAKPVPAVTRK